MNNTSSSSDYYDYNYYYNTAYRYEPKEVKEEPLKVKKAKKEKVHLFNIKDLDL